MNKVVVAISTDDGESVDMLTYETKDALAIAKRQHFGELEDGTSARFFSSESQQELFFDFEEDTLSTNQPENPHA